MTHAATEIQTASPMPDSPSADWGGDVKDWWNLTLREGQADTATVFIKKGEVWGNVQLTFTNCGSSRVPGNRSDVPGTININLRRIVFQEAGENHFIEALDRSPEGNKRAKIRAWNQDPVALAWEAEECGCDGGGEGSES